VLILAYILSPLLLVLPLMVSAVLASVRRRRRRAPSRGCSSCRVSDRDLFAAKLLQRLRPALAITWGVVPWCAVIANVSAWSAVHRLILPYPQWLVMMVWVAPAVAAISLALLTLVSSRAKTTQERKDQLGGAVILRSSSGRRPGAPFLLAPVPVVFGLGVVVWAIAFGLIRFASSRFTRDRLAASA
jgi:hypothetical protein